MGTFPTLQYATKTTTARDGKVKHAAISASTRKISSSSRRLRFLLGLIAAFNLGGLPFVVVVEAQGEATPLPTGSPTALPVPAPTKLPTLQPTSLPSINPVNNRIYYLYYLI